ncbi:YIP1 family protein [Roseobacter sp. HKCCD9010]|uniref:Yip1 family protein n=1 Tax=Rhodobacterales TaxID=204455 RepID=UPI001490F7CC|nr:MULTISPECIES: Yip1 family protein [Rhodobacterales]MBF9050228.1 YIP1 family protein [Rhodobacterales bacterium HKCCD4356]NNV12471.1 YIP1 family protein [Roseobacter sp. HKCCD7357]NNV16064.1 YIP1 family protein [Roseobacter sp. HKCCD8768]NNV25524.1 YIP1 family protein [Roseobacter sp. HKCCD8192]NNV29781.1 YIP1 family protein [Roseobacter sp. HKCCD9061]
MTDMATLGGLVRLARDTVRDPREGAATVLSFAPPHQALWLMFALVIVITIILGSVVDLITDPIEGAVLVFSPVTLGLIQGALLFVMIQAIHHIGRAFGGTGQFHEALLLVIWLQFIFICVQIIQLVALIIVPFLAPLITIAAMALFFWLLVNFIAALHGFHSLGQVFVMVILSIIGIAFLASVALTILGVSVPQGGI